MAVTINASTSAGLVQTADTTGNLSLQSNGTTIAALTSTGLAVTGAGSFSTTLGVTGTSTLAAVNTSGSILAASGANYLTTGAAPVYIGGRSTTGDGYIGVNVKVGVGNYVVNGFAGQIIFGPTGAWDFNTAASGTAGNAVSDTSKMTISNTGAVTIPGTLGVTGQFSFGERAFLNSTTRISVAGATTIYSIINTGSSVGASVALVLVNGYLVATPTNSFVDLVLFMPSGTPVVISSINRGSPAARTYTSSGNSLQLAMASGTYNVANSNTEQAC